MVFEMQFIFFSRYHDNDDDSIGHVVWCCNKHHGVIFVFTLNKRLCSLSTLHEFFFLCIKALQKRDLMRDLWEIRWRCLLLLHITTATHDSLYGSSITNCWVICYAYYMHTLWSSSSSMRRRSKNIYIGYTCFTQTNKQTMTLQIQFLQHETFLSPQGQKINCALKKNIIVVVWKIRHQLLCGAFLTLSICVYTTSSSFLYQNLLPSIRKHALAISKSKCSVLVLTEAEEVWREQIYDVSWYIKPTQEVWLCSRVFSINRSWASASYTTKCHFVHSCSSSSNHNLHSPPRRFYIVGTTSDR